MSSIGMIARARATSSAPWVSHGFARSFEQRKNMDNEDAEWLDREIDHALACAEMARSWAADVRAAPHAHPGVNLAALDATAQAYDIVAQRLEESKR